MRGTANRLRRSATGEADTLRLRLHASGTDAGVEALLECSGDRWVAILTDGGRTETGLGASARTALTVAIQALAPGSAAALLTDPELFAVSWRIRQAV